MAFDAGKVEKREQKRVVVEVNTTEDGEAKTSRYLLRQMTRGEMVRLMAESRKQGEDAVNLALIGRIFESGDEMDGGRSIYDLIDSMDESHQNSFMEHVSKLATASTSQLAAMGVELQ